MTASGLFFISVFLMINTLFIHNLDFIKTVFDVYRVYFCLIKIIIENSLKAVISFREITAF